MAPKIISHGKLRFLDNDRLSIPVPVRRFKNLKVEWKEVALDDQLKQFVDAQRRGPVMLQWPLWFYKDYTLTVEGNVTDAEDVILRVKHYVLRNERNYERLKREVETLEKISGMDADLRVPIPEDVRMFVWQRDGGKCVKCGSQELLEFDHIIPVSKGGSSTERNIQLLCEPCNRSKGSTI